MSINRVVLVGRLTKDVELKSTTSGTNVASFTVAVDGFGKDPTTGENQTSFVSCVAWNQTAKFVSTYCKKGSLVAVDGRLQTRSYDRKDGTKAYVTEVVCERLENLSPRDKQDEGISIDSQDDNQSLSYSDDDLPF